MELEMKRAEEKIQKRMSEKGDADAGKKALEEDARKE